MQATRKSTIFSFSLLLIFTLGSAPSVAQDKVPTPEERAYKFRTSLFQTFGFKFGRLMAAKAQSDDAMFKKHAADLAYLTTMLEEGFEIENSLPEGTEAKPIIWEDFAGFTEKATVLRTAVAGLQVDGAMESFNPRDFGSKNCGGCHREYRIKKE
jgi:cytochrome c556